MFHDNISFYFFFIICCSFKFFSYYTINLYYLYPHIIFYFLVSHYVLNWFSQSLIALTKIWIFWKLQNFRIHSICKPMENFIKFLPPSFENLSSSIEWNIYYNTDNTNINQQFWTIKNWTLFKLFMFFVNEFRIIVKSCVTVYKWQTSNCYLLSIQHRWPNPIIYDGVFGR